MTMYSPTNPVQAPENPKGKTVQQIDEALRDFVLQDTAHLRREAENVTRGGLRPENAAQVVTDACLLVQQVACVSLDQLDDVIVDLRNLRDFLHREGVRVQREISGFLQLNQAAIGSTKFITDNIRQWKEGARGASPHSETELAGIAASSLPPPPLSSRFPPRSVSRAELSRAGAGRRRRRGLPRCQAGPGVLGKRLARYGRFHRDHPGTARAGWMEQETHLLGPCRKLPTMTRPRLDVFSCPGRSTSALFVSTCPCS